MSAALLRQAAAKGRLKDLNKLLESGANVNEADTAGMTPLLYAASESRASCVAALIAAGADVNRAAQNATTALHLAADNDCVVVLQQLLEAGARVDPPVDAKADESPLYKACSSGALKAAKALVAAGASVNLNSHWGNRPLHACIEYDGPSTVPLMRLLVDAGADINAHGFAGKTPLHAASNSESSKATKFLLSLGADPNCTTGPDGSGPTPATRAATSSGLPPGKRPIHSFMLHGANCVGVLQLLLEKGADANAPDDDGKTPMQLADDMQLDEEIKELLKKHGAIDWRTPLDIAVEIGDMEEVMALIAADPSCVNPPGRGQPIPENLNPRKGITYVPRADEDAAKLVDDVMRDDPLIHRSPLQRAIEDKQTDIALALIAAGADLFLIGPEGETPASASIRFPQPKVLDAILQAGYNANALGYRYPEGLSKAKAKSKPFPLPFDESEFLGGETLLHSVCELQDHDDDGDNDDDEDGSNDTDTEPNKYEELVRVLVKHGALVNVRGLWGRTPLHMAVSHLNFGATTALLEAGANPAAVSPGGENVFSLYAVMYAPVDPTEDTPAVKEVAATASEPSKLVADITKFPKLTGIDQEVKRSTDTIALAAEVHACLGRFTISSAGFHPLTTAVAEDAKEGEDKDASIVGSDEGDGRDEEEEADEEADEVEEEEEQDASKDEAAEEEVKSPRTASVFRALKRAADILTSASRPRLRARHDGVKWEASEHISRREMAEMHPGASALYYLLLETLRTSGITWPLHAAACRGDLGGMRTALETGRFPLEFDNWGRSALFYAVCSGSVEAVQVLFDVGVPVTAAVVSNAGQLTPLHVAAAAGNAEMVQFLLNRFPPMTPDAATSYIGSPLHFAVASGSVECVNALFAAGYAHDGSFRISEKTHTAASMHSLDAVETLAVPLKAASGGAGEASDAAAAEDEDEEPHKSKMCLAHPLVFAAQLGNAAMVARLAEALARAAESPSEVSKTVDPLSINVPPSILHWTTGDAVAALLAASAPSNFGSPKFSALVHVSVHHRDDLGAAPLHYAALRGDATAVAALLAAGSDVLAVDTSGRTALHYAALAPEKERKSLIMLLLKAAGALVEVTDGDGLTAEEVADKVDKLQSDVSH